MLTPNVKSNVVSESSVLLRRGTEIGAKSTITRDEHCGDADGDHAGGNRDHAGLGEQPADQVAAARADRMPHRDVAPLPLGAGQKKIGDVGARDHEQHRHGAEQDPERPRECAEHVLLERHHARNEPLDDFAVHRRSAVLFGQAARDQIELCDQRRGVHAAANAGHDRQSELAGIDLLLDNPERAREPEQHVFAREIEVRPHDADDGARRAGDRVAAAEHVRIAAEPLHPQRIAQHGRAIALLERRQPAELRCQPSVSNSDSVGFDIHTRSTRSSVRSVLVNMLKRADVLEQIRLRLNSR